MDLSLSNSGWIWAPQIQIQGIQQTSNGGGGDSDFSVMHSLL